MAELPRTLSVWRGTAMMLNIVLGAGLLTLPGLAAQSAGASAPLIWALCAVASAPLLIVFALLGRRWPGAGGLATILSKSFGRFGYISGTLLFLGAVIFGLPAIALTGGHYLAAALGGPAPLYAAGLIIAAALVNVVSAEIAGRVNAVLASVLLIALLAVLAIGWNVTSPTLPSLDAMRADLPTRHMLGATVMMVFFAFTGWEVAAHLGGDFRNPKRDMPLAMALSFLIVVLLYGGLALVVHAMATTARPEAPFADLFGQIFGPTGVIVVSFLSVLLIFANLAAAVWAVSRMVYAAATEGVLPQFLTAQRRGMPHLAVITTITCLLSVICTAWVGTVTLQDLLAMAGQNFLLLYIGVAAVLVRMPKHSSERVLGWVCIVIGCALIGLRGSDGMIYPAILLTCAAVLATQKGALAKRIGTPTRPNPTAYQASTHRSTP
ncbi:amino acid permease (plasmid) [Rhodobacteraceae bacterium SC52]|nr:amino acid permease [Rhodobacteraceae bacterium SC52]